MISRNVYLTKLNQVTLLLNFPKLILITKPVKLKHFSKIKPILMVSKILKLTGVPFTKL